jgi:hypothetical protein
MNDQQNEPRTCPYCDAPRQDTFENRFRFDCGTSLRADDHKTVKQGDVCQLRVGLRAAQAEAARLREALERISKCEDAPAIDATGEWQTGLHCGVEDRDCRDRYDGAEYGHTVGVEKALEWASNAARAALAKEGQR